MLLPGFSRNLPFTAVSRESNYPLLQGGSFSPFVDQQKGVFGIIYLTDVWGSMEIQVGGAKAFPSVFLGVFWLYLLCIWFTTKRRYLHTPFFTLSLSYSLLHLRYCLKAVHIMHLSHLPFFSSRSPEIVERSLETGIAQAMFTTRV